jgi:hypothetical protein
MPSHAQPPFGRENVSRPYSCFVDLSHVPLVVIQQGLTPRGGAVLVPGIPAVLLFVDPISPLENLSVNFPFLEFYLTRVFGLIGPERRPLRAAALRPCPSRFWASLFGQIYSSQQNVLQLSSFSTTLLHLTA